MPGLARVGGPPGLPVSIPYMAIDAKSHTTGGRKGDEFLNITISQLNEFTSLDANGERFQQP